MALPPDPTPSCIYRSKNTRDLCSVATYNVRSTRNVSMPPPPHPIMTSEHTLETCVLRARCSVRWQKQAPVEIL